MGRPGRAGRARRAAAPAVGRTRRCRRRPARAHARGRGTRAGPAHGSHCAAALGTRAAAAAAIRACRQRGGRRPAGRVELAASKAVVGTECRNHVADPWLCRVARSRHSTRAARGARRATGGGGGGAHRLSCPGSSPGRSSTLPPAPELRPTTWRAEERALGRAAGPPNPACKERQRGVGPRVPQPCAVPEECIVARCRAGDAPVRARDLPLPLATYRGRRSGLSTLQACIPHTKHLLARVAASQPPQASPRTWQRCAAAGRAAASILLCCNPPRVPQVSTSATRHWLLGPRAPAARRRSALQRSSALRPTWGNARHCSSLTTWPGKAAEAVRQRARVSGGACVAAHTCCLHVKRVALHGRPLALPHAVHLGSAQDQTTLTSEDGWHKRAAHGAHDQARGAAALAGGESRQAAVWQARGARRASEGSGAQSGGRLQQALGHEVGQRARVWLLRWTAGLKRRRRCPVGPPVGGARLGAPLASSTRFGSGADSMARPRRRKSWCTVRRLQENSLTNRLTLRGRWVRARRGAGPAGGGGGARAVSVERVSTEGATDAGSHGCCPRVGMSSMSALWALACCCAGRGAWSAG